MDNVVNRAWPSMALNKWSRGCFEISTAIPLNCSRYFYETFRVEENTLSGNLFYLLLCPGKLKCKKLEKEINSFSNFI